MTMRSDPPFLDPTVLCEAERLLHSQREQYSIDAWYSQVGIGPEEVGKMLREAVGNAAADLSFLPVDGILKVHREVVAPADWNHSIETRPHRYWSHNASLAHAHWGEGGGIRWLLSGSISLDDVDQAATVACNANPMLSDEAEVRLKPGASVTIERVEPRPTGHSHPVL